MKYFYVTLTGCLFLGGCGFLGDPSKNETGWQVQPGTVISHRDSSTIDLGKDTVHVGQPLHVTATTFGGGCTRKAGVRTEVRGRRATFTPLDSVYTPRPNEACTMILKEISHTAEVTFESPGEARVVIQGKGKGPGFTENDDVQLNRMVFVEK